MSNAAARRAVPDPGYATLHRVLRRVRDTDLATARALNLDREELAELTEEERQAIQQLGEDDPDLQAELTALVDQLESEYAAIPTVRVGVQPLDKNGNPSGSSYTIESQDGVLNLGYSVLMVHEFLLLVQAEEPNPERGFAIDSEWAHRDWGSGIPWPSDTVTYYLHSSISNDEKNWMRLAIERMEDGTGIRFREHSGPEWWLEIWQGLCLSSELRISKKQLGGDLPGWATVGKVCASKLVMDSDHVTDEDHFDHELGHVLGLLHEHQRYDRDTYVKVERTGSSYDKIPERVRHKFLWWTWYTDNSTTFSTPYDYHSIMHYRQYTGIKLRSNGDYWIVHEDNNDEWGDENGNTWLSPWDIYTIKRLYGITPNEKPDFIPAPEYP